MVIGCNFATRDDALSLDEALRGDDVSHAWSTWSSAAEAALADACQFAGGPMPDRGLVLGGGSFFGSHCQVGPKVRKARRKFADPQGVVMYHDASTALFLDLRRRFEAVGDVQNAMIRDGITLARSLELTVQWDGIIRIGPVHPLLCRILIWLGEVGLVIGGRYLRNSILGFRISSTGLLCIVGRRVFGCGGIG